jgi:hypothetical protein
MDDLGAERACVIACSKDRRSEMQQTTLTLGRKKDNQ